MLLVNTWTLLAYDLSPLQRLLGVSAVSLICSYLACLPYLLKSLPAARYDWLAKAIKMANSLVWVWPIWALLEAEHIVHMDIGIVPTMILWCLYISAEHIFLGLLLEGGGIAARVLKNLGIHIDKTRQEIGNEEMHLLRS